MDLDPNEFRFTGFGDVPNLWDVSKRREQVSVALAKQETFSYKVAPFFWVGLGWGVFGAVASAIDVVNPGQAIFWNLALWFLCILDFFGTVQMVRGTLAIRAGSSTTGGSPLAQALGGGALKLACFGLLGVVVWGGKAAPLRALLMGLGTMVLVPLLGGVWWFKRDHKENRNG